MTSTECAYTRCMCCAIVPTCTPRSATTFAMCRTSSRDVTRPCFREGTIDLVPNNFSEMRNILRARTSDPLILATASPPDRHGYFSLGLNADYVASFIGKARFFLEANPAVPRTFGRNQVHISQVVGWSEADYPLVEVAPVRPTEIDEHIAALVADRIPDRATIQTGIGSIPNAILSALVDHRDLGVHTELLSDGVMDLVDRGVITGVAKQLNRTKAVGTFALGTRSLYDFLDENAAFELWPVRYVNDPRVIAQEAGFVSINATIAVDLLGQCASETVHGTYYSSSGGQADFARGAMYSEGGQGFVVLHSTTRGRHDLEDRLAAGTRRRCHHVEEHGRQSRDRVGRGGAERTVDPGARHRAHRRRTPGPPGPAAVRGSIVGVLLRALISARAR